MIYKRCGRCGKRIPAGTTCECVIEYRKKKKEYFFKKRLELRTKEKDRQRYADYDHNRRNRKAYEFYHSPEWVWIRTVVLDKDGYIDVYKYMTEGVVVVADTVHHVIPLEEDWDKRFDIDNLMSLHHSTHSIVEALYKNDKKAAVVQLQDMLLRYRGGERMGVD